MFWYKSVGHLKWHFFCYQIWNCWVTYNCPSSLPAKVIILHHQWASLYSLCLPVWGQKGRWWSGSICSHSSWSPFYRWEEGDIQTCDLSKNIERRCWLSAYILGLAVWSWNLPAVAYRRLSEISKTEAEHFMWNLLTSFLIITEKLYI